MCPKKYKDCKICQECDSDWEFIKLNLKAAIDFIRWDELIAMFCLYFFSIGILGWWGLPLALIFHAGMFTMGGGAVGDWHMEYPLEEPNYIGCVKGIKDCKICHNENRIALHY